MPIEFIDTTKRLPALVIRVGGRSEDIGLRFILKITSLIDDNSLPRDSGILLEWYPLDAFTLTEAETAKDYDAVIRVASCDMNVIDSACKTLGQLKADEELRGLKGALSWTIVDEKFMTEMVESARSTDRMEIV